MEISAWGEWAIAGISLAVGFGLLYAKVASIVTRIDGLAFQMERDYEDHLRIWQRLDVDREQITKIAAQIKAE